MAEWIDVNERLPKVGEEILAYNENENKYFVAAYSDTYRTFFVGGFAYGGITHWCELPEPPRTLKERGGEK